MTRWDRIRNKVIRGTTQTGRLREKAREARLRWFGHLQKRNSGDIGRSMVEMELPGRRRRGRPKRRYMDAVKEDMQSRRYREQVEMESSDSLWKPLKRDKQ